MLSGQMVNSAHAGSQNHNILNTTQFVEQKCFLKNGEERHIIKVGTIGGHNPLCLKSNKIRYHMISKNRR